MAARIVLEEHAFRINECNSEKKNSILVSLFTEKCIKLIIVQNFLIIGQNNYCNKIPIIYEDNWCCMFENKN